jgi:NhaP-type Na+/H+ or K+/H+ antiporter
MNDYLCGLSGRWSVGPYCVDGSIVGLVVLIGVAIVIRLLWVLAARNRSQGAACPVCGQVYETRHQMVAHRWRDHEDHEAS